MDRLTALDAGFLHAEDADRRVSLAIGALVILEGPIPEFDSLLSTLGERIAACPRFAQRLRSHLFDLDAPEWVDDPDFDLTHHVRRLSLPLPGDDHELFRLVADVMSWRLDRSRPLWEIWVVEGLADGRWAIVLKVHHCIADGIATAHMLAGLSDGGPGHSFAGRIHAASEPARSKPLWQQILNPMTWTTAAARMAHGAVDIAAGLTMPSASAALNGPITNLRRYSAGRVSLDDVRHVCQVFDVTINDVALAALTESFRAYLIRHGEQPLPDTLRTLVPVSMRHADSLDQTDNRVSLLLPFLPVEEENAVARLRTVHARLSHAKSTGQHQAGNAATSLANHIPFALTALATRLLTRLPQHGVATVATNVPGPAEPLQIMGRKVSGVMPIPPIAMQLRTGVAMLSYAGELYFGILADFDAAPDIDELAHGVEDAVARLVATAKRRKPSRDRRGLSLVVSA
ncbi:WS/DGAT/MGAT family O-acyltransferase [Mycobacterium sp. MMS18-G62]